MIRSFLSVLSMMLFCAGHVNASDARYNEGDYVVDGGVVVKAPGIMETTQVGPSTPLVPAEDAPTIMVTPPESPLQTSDDARAHDTPSKK